MQQYFHLHAQPDHKVQLDKDRRQASAASAQCSAQQNALHCSAPSMMTLFNETVVCLQVLWLQKAKAQDFLEAVSVSDIMLADMLTIDTATSCLHFVHRHQQYLSNLRLELLV